MKITNEGSLPAGALELIKRIATHGPVGDCSDEYQLARELGYPADHRAEVSFNWPRCGWIWAESAGRWIDYVVFVYSPRSTDPERVYVYEKEEEK